MIRVYETTRSLPFYRPVALTRLPLLFHREHLFPYTSYGETEAPPVARKFRLVTLENEYLRVEVMPELGGRVYSLWDKRIGKEILFRNPVVKPVRVLPIWAFISGGIEFNFPIAHSPTSICEVGCCYGCAEDYGFIRVGEREARSGLEWSVELGLVRGQAALVQRTSLRNHTHEGRPWMLWTIAAVPSTPGTEFVHPPHRVLVHDHRVLETEWPGEGLNWDRNLSQMTALFWKPGSAPQFGAFHHDLGFGLMHLAQPSQLPGKKVWSYGHGRHRAWGEATTEGGQSYAEIESGPLLDQSQKQLFASGAEYHFEEYWIPVHSRAEFDTPKWPRLALPPQRDAWLGWSHSPWQTEWELFRSEEAELPASTVPTGMDLEMPLRHELDLGNQAAAEPLGLWLAFHGRHEEALKVLGAVPCPANHRLTGLILWKALNRAEEAAARLEAGPLHDPVAVVELDELYAELGQTARREMLLANAPAHWLVAERRADLSLAAGKPEEALRLLSQTPWQRQHQRYVRTELWRRAHAALGSPVVEIPDYLNEDNLAPFGAYWSDS